MFCAWEVQELWSFRNCFLLPVIYDSQRNAWLTPEISRLLFNNFVLAGEENCSNKNCQRSGSLYSCWIIAGYIHQFQSWFCGNSCATYLPADVTFVIELMDHGVIENLKLFYRGAFAWKLLNSDCSVHDFFSFNLNMLFLLLVWH